MMMMMDDDERQAQRKTEWKETLREGNGNRFIPEVSANWWLLLAVRMFL